MESFNVAFPLTKTKIEKKVLKNNWMTKELLKSRNTLRFLTEQYRRDSSLKLKLKMFRKVYLKVLKLSKKKSYLDKIKGATNKQKAMWKTIKEIENKEQKFAEDISKTLKVKERNSQDNKEIADLICDYFTSIGKEDTSNLTQAVGHCTRFYNQKNILS